MKSNQPIMLIILDGWGHRIQSVCNAVAQADTPFLDHLFETYPHTLLTCSGKAVGLPEGVMGNSEVGHLNIGAGRVVLQDMLRIDSAIESNTFKDNPAFIDLIAKIKASQGCLHLMGLLSDGAVHSHINHLFALIQMAKQHDVPVNIHAIMDGRDTPPDSGERYLNQLNEFLTKTGWGKIASICGRFYAMDRDKRWERIARAYALYTSGEGIQSSDVMAAIKESYDRGETDEFVQPISIGSLDDNNDNILRDNDGVIFFNFRADRAREITSAITQKQFDYCKRDRVPHLAGYVCMTQYDINLKLPIAFPPLKLQNIFGEVISRAGYRQLRIAETEKYAHVTYFFNGGEEIAFENEDRTLIPSPREIETYDQKPEMSAYKVTQAVLEALSSRMYDVIVLNYANLDMVGHTGKMDAALKAVKAVDTCVNKVIQQLLAMDGIALITADHGNAEKMCDKNGKPHTAHTTQPVPLILIKRNADIRLRSDGIIGDIAPTLLELMAIEKPKEMSGHSLLT
ncbi:MAG: 2,3-bisphosphoglycerate-independent phosphoglycerate mutase [Candidatus Magnetoglobus multicellularis str. Araruama]|uniref:2,3-bisphosphoglycerate-independent phosphoglycerate mutase n=1 Tax=Candidatus Magnetoglobus multicellularis str. Araruama TaxID=890399 RepID=A0A1V1PA54_9BACT|nr:MAG: 2,3-bisphosphoglycerate-independent phosphoglycerate mutase [Candidatus Magnetoglobus multicellularis str. Araruama]